MNTSFLRLVFVNVRINRMSFRTIESKKEICLLYTELYAYENTFYVHGRKIQSVDV